MTFSQRKKETAAGKGSSSRPRLWVCVLCALLLAVVCFSAYQLADQLLRSKTEREDFEALAAIVSERPSVPEATDVRKPFAASDNGGTEDVQDPCVTALPVLPTERAMLPQYVPLYEMNHDVFGWLSIEGTGIDYPVMYTPDDPEYYIKRAFDGSDSGSGVPFMDGRCLRDGNYCLVYGHHMKDNTMFGLLPRYAEQDYCEEHPVIRFDTLYEQREYQVIAAFFSRVYDKTEPGVFRYYEYFDLTDEKVFEEYVESVREAAIYDTGFEVRYGDELLALSTCNYHTKDGRFVVVAKRTDGQLLPP